MDLVKFLQFVHESNSQDTLDSKDLESNLFFNKFIILFKAQCFSSLLSYHLYSYFKKNLKRVECLYIDGAPEEYESKLKMHFLGKSSHYFLIFSQSITKSLYKKWLGFVSSYKGPHKLFIFDPVFNELCNEYFLVIDILEELTLDKNYYKKLYSLFFKEIKTDLLDKEIEAILTSNNYKSKFSKGSCIDDIFRIFRYRYLLGEYFEQFIKDYKVNLITTNQSLFILSQHLFSRSISNFFEYWSTYQQLYPQEYWISFFSEQIWQAALFIKRVEQLGFFEAKKYAYRLPFSFINKDYKQYSFNYLQQKYLNIYILDYKRKNISTLEYGLDNWIINFLLNK